MKSLLHLLSAIELIYEYATEKPSATKSAIAEYFSKRFKTAKPIIRTTIGDIRRKQDVFYDQENINRPNETKRLRDLLDKLPPNKTLSHKKKVNGVKISKERISVGACANASGTDKVKLVFIHKYQKPRSFGKTWTPYHLVDYYWNQKAWITQLIMPN